MPQLEFHGFPQRPQPLQLWERCDVNGHGIAYRFNQLTPSGDRTGWAIVHCGLNCPRWPYYIEHPGPAPLEPDPVAHHGYTYRLLSEAKDRVEELNPQESE